MTEGVTNDHSLCLLPSSLPPFFPPPCLPPPPVALDKVSDENIQDYFCHVWDYMYGYLLGHQAGIQLEELVNKLPKWFKSH